MSIVHTVNVNIFSRGVENVVFFVRYVQQRKLVARVIGRAHVAVATKFNKFGCQEENTLPHENFYVYCK